MRFPLLALLLLAGCDRAPADQLRGHPLAAWRRVPGVPVRRVAVATGRSRAVLMPDLSDLLCSGATRPGDRVICSIWLDGRTGRPDSRGWSENPAGVDASFYFTPENPLLFRRDTRTDPQERAGHDGDLPEEPVLGWARGVVAGRRMAAGCWREYFDEPHAPIYCQLWIEVPGEGLIAARYYVPDRPGPFRLDQARLRGLVHMLVATERSFTRV